MAVGRLARYKNVDDVIRIVDGVRERGHGVHLRVVGPSYDEPYRDELTSMADERPYVELEGTPPQGAGRAALHPPLRHPRQTPRALRDGRAEMAAAGALPFVPANGGQRDIVDGQKSLLYHTVEDAVETVDRALSDRDRQHDLRPDPGDIERRFGRQRSSASTNATYSPSDVRMPALRAALGLAGLSRRRTRSRSSPTASSTSSVPSVGPPSTTISSNGWWVCANTLPMAPESVDARS